MKYDNKKHWYNIVPNSGHNFLTIGIKIVVFLVSVIHTNICDNIMNYLTCRYFFLWHTFKYNINTWYDAKISNILCIKYSKFKNKSADMSVSYIKFAHMYNSDFHSLDLG